MEQISGSPPEPVTRGDTRAHERARVRLLRGDMKIGNGDWRPVIVHDLSTHGFKIGRPPGAQRNLPFKIRLAGLEPLPATISWLREERAGASFEVPLSPYVFEHIARRYSNTETLQRVSGDAP